ncbi:MAG TPA: hypothetical protein VMZ53_04095 [Kofleriaceae bacterium]|nr:hypothetical protein [Kofleriaceae bacterium]
MNKFALVLLSLVPAVALAQPKAGAPATPPAPKADPKAPAAQPAPPPAPVAAPAEVKATVEAFKGNWKFDASMSATGMPGMDKPMAGKMSFNCKEVAGKTGVSCESKMKTPMGPMDALFVVAFNPYDKKVHFIGITNMNEVHDHLCTWKTATELTCEPLKAGMGPGGDEVTEDVTITWTSKKEVAFKSVSKMTKGGATMTFEGKGKR